ncbi:hypothetical protein [Hyphomonas johnsonii]|jgi:hypothetical protein|uniref:Uncharacterized protein n=1 Tax=Hyphomonas johnsonii MHS-2 TaxID=1280950 RepID=A0A059FP67_9PROT|nr:hypothetical protein [Hyphomonas johnsonii]KCZ92429.1 hypothetical protein HJO_10349 [Hyphomonas johnsonii MHS-2]
MRLNIFTTIVAVICVAFLATLGVFYIQEGSFERAGARMDVALGNLPENAARAANETAETTGDVIQDIADGPDDSPG